MYEKQIIPKKKEKLKFHPKKSRQLIDDVFRMTHGYTMASPVDSNQFLLRAIG